MFACKIIIPDTGKKVCKEGGKADGKELKKELRKEGIKGGGVGRLERVPDFLWAQP